MTLAHFGMAVLIAGASGASAWKTESIQVQAPGDTINLAGYALTFQGVTNVPGPNYTAERAAIEVRRGDRLVATLHPERRTYIQPPEQTTFSSIDRSGLYGAPQRRLHHRQPGMGDVRQRRIR